MELMKMYCEAQALYAGLAPEESNDFDKICEGRNFTKVVFFASDYRRIGKYLQWSCNLMHFGNLVSNLNMKFDIIEDLADFNIFDDYLSVFWLRTIHDALENAGMFEDNINYIKTEDLPSLQKGCDGGDVLLVMPKQKQRCLSRLPALKDNRLVPLLFCDGYLGSDIAAMPIIERFVFLNDLHEEYPEINGFNYAVFNFTHQNFGWWKSKKLKREQINALKNAFKN